jgi:hypothetical protein
MARSRLTQNMVQALLVALQGGRFLGNASTSKALFTRGFLRPDGSLTDSGFDEAILHTDLETQCEGLGLSIRRILAQSDRKPEEVALRVAHQEGWRGISCEGRGPFILLKAGMLHFLREHSALGEDDARTAYLEAQILSYQQRHLGEFGAEVAPRNALYGPIDYERWEAALMDLLTSEAVQSECPDLDVRVGMDIVHEVGFERWFLIAEELCRDPYGFRNGWPDLFLVRGEGEILGVEVKVRDRLHRSQIHTLPVLHRTIGIPVEIWKLVSNQF